MDTIINLILAAALQFTGIQVAKQDLKFNHQEQEVKTEQCGEAQAYFITNNEQFCKEKIT
jgi:hypothetical protein